MVDVPPPQYIIRCPARVMVRFRSPPPSESGRLIFLWEPPLREGPPLPPFSKNVRQTLRAARAPAVLALAGAVAYQATSDHVVVWLWSAFLLAFGLGLAVSLYFQAAMRDPVMQGTLLEWTNYFQQACQTDLLAAARVLLRESSAQILLYPAGTEFEVQVDGRVVGRLDPDTLFRDRDRPSPDSWVAILPTGERSPRYPDALTALQRLIAETGSSRGATDATEPNIRRPRSA